MSLLSIGTQIQYVELECGKCGCRFAFTQKYYNHAAENGSEWYCPNGHNWRFAPTTVEKLQAELDRHKRILDAKQAELERARVDRDEFEKKAQGYKGAMRKIQKRVGAGTCPCCKRTVSQLARHMKCKHPDYGKSQQ